jgi:DivIVA domain-containing protein
VVSGESIVPGQSESGLPPTSPEQDDGPTGSGAVPPEIRDVSFAVSVRGYDRGAVDAYVSRVGNLVAELEATRSPEAAVRQALERVGDQTRGILEQAGETAERITVAARQEAEELTNRAKGEAEDLVARAKSEAAELLAHSNADAESILARARREAAEHVQRSRDEVAALREEAEVRMRELDTDTTTIRQERGRLVEDIREIASRIQGVATAADARFPPPEDAGHAEDAILERDVADTDVTDLTATDDATAETEAHREPPE